MVAEAQDRSADDSQKITSPRALQDRSGLLRWQVRQVGRLVARRAIPLTKLMLLPVSSPCADAAHAQICARDRIGGKMSPDTAAGGGSKDGIGGKPRACSKHTHPRTSIPGRSSSSLLALSLPPPLSRSLPASAWLFESPRPQGQRLRFLVCNMTDFFCKTNQRRDGLCDPSTATSINHTQRQG